MTKRARVTLSMDAVRAFCTSKGITIAEFKRRLQARGILTPGLELWMYKHYEPPIVFLMALMDEWPKDDPFELLEVHDARST